jgi:hypothetical protein
MLVNIHHKDTGKHKVKGEGCLGLTRLGPLRFRFLAT